MNIETLTVKELLDMLARLNERNDAPFGNITLWDDYSASLIVGSIDKGFDNLEELVLFLAGPDA